MYYPPEQNCTTSTCTCHAALTGLLGWIAVEAIFDGRTTAIGAGSGAVAGLVAITPAAGSSIAV